MCLLYYGAGELDTPDVCSSGPRRDRTSGFRFSRPALFHLSYRADIPAELGRRRLAEHTLGVFNLDSRNAQAAAHEDVMPRERRSVDPVEAAYQVVQRATRTRADDDDQPRQRVLFDVTGPPVPVPDGPPSEDAPQ